MIEKLKKYKEEKTEITFRLKNHQNYFITGVINDIETIQLPHNIGGLDTPRIIEEGKYLITILLPNKIKTFFYSYEMDMESICPSSYNPIRFFIREQITEALRNKIFERDNYECQLKLDGCTKKAECCDHLVPVSCGGLSTEENLVAACNHCNLKKSNKILF